MGYLKPHAYLLRISGSEGDSYQESVWVDVPAGKGLGSASISMIDHGSHKTLRIELPVVPEPGTRDRIVKNDFDFDPQNGLTAVEAVVQEGGTDKGKIIVDLDEADS